MSTKFEVRKNVSRNGEHPCKTCERIVCTCEDFESAWLAMCTFMDEMRERPIGTTCSLREMHSQYDAAKNHGGFGMIAERVDGTSCCACINDVDVLDD